MREESPHLWKSAMARSGRKDPLGRTTSNEVPPMPPMPGCGRDRMPAGNPRADTPCPDPMAAPVLPKSGMLLPHRRVASAMPSGSVVSGRLLIGGEVISLARVRQCPSGLMAPKKAACHQEHTEQSGGFDALLGLHELFLRASSRTARTSPYFKVRPVRRAA